MVEKEEGKGLSSNDFTDTEKEKLAGIPALDYTSLDEQAVTGEFFWDVNGHKKQVYTRTWLFDSSFAKYDYGTYAGGFIQPDVAAVVDYLGHIYTPHDGYTRPLLPVLQNITSNNTSLFMVDFAVYGNSLVCNVLSTGPDKDSLIGKQIKGVISVKYIK